MAKLNLASMEPPAGLERLRSARAPSFANFQGFFHDVANYGDRTHQGKPPTKAKRNGPDAKKPRHLDDARA